MSAHDLELELATGLSAVRQASKLCRNVQGGIAPDALEKKDRSPVTIADYASQALVCGAIKLMFPDDPIIAEEDSTALRQPEQEEKVARILAECEAVEMPLSADDLFRSIDYGGAQDYSDRFWTLDPIDGTKGFLRKEQYAVSLALIIDGKLALSVVGCPNLDTPSGTGGLYAAVAGHGASAYMIDSVGAEPQPISTSAETDAAQARFVESVESGHSSHGDAERIASALGMTRDSVRLDSQAKYAIVARGDAEIYLRLPTRAGYVERIWDHAGGTLLVEEAGGTVTDLAGNPLDFTHGAGLEQNRGIVATNGPLHRSVLKAISELGLAD